MWVGDCMILFLNNWENFVIIVWYDCNRNCYGGNRIGDL